MTIYIHFRGPRAAVKLYNVSTVEDDGPRRIKTTSIFSDEAGHFEDVRSVAIQPEEPEDQ